MSHIAIIPARAGSKSIPNKNMVRLGKKRLIDISIDSAKDAGFFNRIIVTTDIPDFLSEDPSGYETLERGPEISSDTALMKDVVMDVIEKKNLAESDIIWLLQPTTPFREKKDFLDIKREIPKFTSAISVSPVGDDHPCRMYTLKGGKLYAMSHNNFSNKQDLLPVYIRNGAFYVVRVRDFKKNFNNRRGPFYIKHCFGHVMESARGVNIDNHEDLIVAKTFLERGAV